MGLFLALQDCILYIFSLLSTAAIFYTIGYIYTGREISFKKVMSVMPKVWKRGHFLVHICCFFVYRIVANIDFVAYAILVWGTGFTRVSFIDFFVLYFLGIVYLSIIW